MVKLDLVAGATVAFSILPIGAKFSWLGDTAINVKVSDFSAESYNGLYAWSAIDRHFRTDSLITFWE